MVSHFGEAAKPIRFSVTHLFFAVYRNKKGEIMNQTNSHPSGESRTDYTRGDKIWGAGIIFVLALIIAGVFAFFDASDRYYVVEEGYAAVFHKKAFLGIGDPVEVMPPGQYLQDKDTTNVYLISKEDALVPFQVKVDTSNFREKAWKLASFISGVESKMSHEYIVTGQARLNLSFADLAAWSKMANGSYNWGGLLADPIAEAIEQAFKIVENPLEDNESLRLTASGFLEPELPADLRLKPVSLIISDVKPLFEKGGFTENQATFEIKAGRAEEKVPLEAFVKSFSVVCAAALIVLLLFHLCWRNSWRSWFLWG